MLRSNDVLTPEDIEQINLHGLTVQGVEAQLARFASGVVRPHLMAPCTIGHGVTRLSDDERSRLTALFEDAVSADRVTKFTPASGAASRMFKLLSSYYYGSDDLTRSAVVQEAGQDDVGAKKLLEFLDQLDQFAFFNDLARVMEKDNVDCQTLLAEGAITDILEYVLTERGLAYAGLAKGLIPFHLYRHNPDRACTRTSLEEHLAEAVEIFSNSCCRLHFTVSPEHQDVIAQHLQKACSRYQHERRLDFDISLSTQKSATDTIAADENNQPFRDEAGRLVFRPGGHGALLQNLNDLKGDIVFIKNIDNIAKQSLRRENKPALQSLGGLLVEIQNILFGYLQNLSAGAPPPHQIEEMLGFVSTQLNQAIPEAVMTGDDSRKKTFLMTTFNRPLRICGVVKNAGEPGGGPFHVQNPDGGTSLQIVESAQVDMNDTRQKQIWKSSTHFNPVIIFCGLRDFQGKSFHLPDFVDPAAGIITEKSLSGKPLKALEHPGLWNGAMAFWNTVFVELPPTTFNPVKTVFDLLRDGHQPDED